MDHTDPRLVPFSVRRNQHGDHEYVRWSERRDVRNASSGSAIATAYWWSSGSRIIDADIVFWDGAFKFFTGSTECANGFYIADIAAHEFGHVLGLGHSTVAGATMYPSVSSCATGNRTLAPDDIAGVEALYPPASNPLPLAPTGFRIVS